MGSTAGHPKHIARLMNYISWFEIPVYDIRRAATFYNAIYGMEMEVVVNGDFAMAYFPADKGIGGALIAGPGCYPSDTGPLIYLNAGSDLDGVLARVEPAGGRVIMLRSLISESAGHFALFIDSEGNRLALHEGPAAVTVPKPAPKTARPKVAAKRTAPAKGTPKKRK